MSNSYWKTVNENGGGYVKRAATVRSKAQVEFDLSDAKRDLASAIIDAEYRDGEEGSAYKVERLQKLVASLESELSA